MMVERKLEYGQKEKVKRRKRGRPRSRREVIVPWP